MNFNYLKLPLFFFIISVSFNMEASNSGVLNFPANCEKKYMHESKLNKCWISFICKENTSNPQELYITYHCSGHKKGLYMTFKSGPQYLAVNSVVLNDEGLLFTTTRDKGSKKVKSFVVSVNNQNFKEEILLSSDLGIYEISSREKILFKQEIKCKVNARKTTQCYSEKIIPIPSPPSSMTTTD